MRGFNSDKAQLDSQFSLTNTMTIDQLEELTNGYEAVKIQTLSRLHDTSDKLEFLYELIRLRRG